MTRSASAVRPRVQVRTAAAALISAPRCVTLLHRPLPQPGPGQVRVRLGSCGVCASSLPVWQGRRWFEYPRQAGAPGHEGCGVVEAVGDGVPASRIGERVALLSYHAFATHDVAPASHAIRLPRSLEGRLFPGEALGCAMNIFRRAGVRRGDRVAIVGAGFLGALLTQLAARAGASVAAFSRRPSALRMSEAMGAEDACLVDGEQACRRDEALEPGRETLVARSAEDVVEHLERLTPDDAADIGRRARRRVLREHTYQRRALQVQQALTGSAGRAGDVVRT